MNWCKKLKWVVVVFCLGWLCVSQAQAAPPVVAAGSRVALLIGNARYNAGLPALTNPGRDVAILSQSLKKLDFEVQVVSDADFKSMSRAVRGFGTKAQGAEVAFFYYSGHGMQAREENYLIPVDARVESESDLDSEAMSLKALMRQLEDARPKTAVVVLDACRDNPVASRSKSASKGLGRVQNPPVNTLVVFAAQAGTTAEDNGVFAKALADAMVQPNVGIRRVFDNVGRSVRTATGNKQSIQRDDQLSDDVVLLASLKPELAAANPSPAIPSPNAPTPPGPIATTPGPGAAAGVSLSDLQKEEETRQQWVQWQARMKSDFETVSRFEGSRDLKLKAWERFLSVWSQDNPLSREDDELRAQAQGRRDDLQKQASAAVTTTATTVAAAPALPSSAGQPSGQVFKDCQEVYCPEMVVVPGGSFMMGSNNGQDNEKPIHQVNIKSFAMGKYEVTQGQWRAVMGTRAC